MGIEKLFTVEDVANMTGLTSRTIRNYLKDGKLKGKKIGVQWRFTEQDILKLFENIDFQKEVSDAKNQLVEDFLSVQNKKMSRICSIIDYPTNGVIKPDIENICLKINEKIEDYHEEKINFSYQFFNETKMVRFIIIGSIDKALEIVQIIKENME